MQKSESEKKEPQKDESGKNWQQIGIHIVMILVAFVLLFGIASHIAVLFRIDIITGDNVNRLEKLHNIVNGSATTFLTTLVIVFLVYIGIYFLKNTDHRIEEVQAANKEVKKLQEELKTLLNEKIEDFKSKDIQLEKLSRALALHTPIAAYIYTTTSIWAAKKLPKKEKPLLMSFFYKINRQIRFINNELTKQDNKNLGTELRQMLTGDYLKDSIDNIEKIISDNKLDWDVAKKTLFDLKEIQKKIGKVEND